MAQIAASETRKNETKRSIVRAPVVSPGSGRSANCGVSKEREVYLNIRAFHSMRSGTNLLIRGVLTLLQSSCCKLVIMEITEEQYARIKDSLPVQRGNVSLSNLQFLNAVLYVAEHGCKWRGLPKRFGNWHTIYTRMNRWSKSGAMDRVFEKLQLEQIVRIRIESLSLDSTSVKVHPDGTGALKKTDPSRSANRAADGLPRFIWLPRMLGPQ